MTFVSFSQNFEDVILNRIFRDKERGFYIDVGAASPSIHSVTKAFYDRGWQGINIEPNSYFFDQLVSDRPRDINLRIAAGDVAERRTMQISPRMGLSTFRADIAKQHEQLEESEFVSEVIQVRTLDEIWEELVETPVDFLKIDAEGYEQEVIAGINLRQHRPKIIIVEATAPFTNIRIDGNHVSVITDSGYDELYFDGLNAWYVDGDEVDKFEDVFNLPPNVADNFVASNFLAAVGQVDVLSDNIRRLSSELDASSERVAELSDLYTALSARCAEIERGYQNIDTQLKAKQAELDEVFAQLVFQIERASQLEREISHSKAN